MAKRSKGASKSARKKSARKGASSARKGASKKSARKGAKGASKGAKGASKGAKGASKGARKESDGNVAVAEDAGGKAVSNQYGSPELRAASAARRKAWRASQRLDSKKAVEAKQVAGRQKDAFGSTFATLAHSINIAVAQGAMTIGDVLEKPCMKGYSHRPRVRQHVRWLREAGVIEHFDDGSFEIAADYKSAAKQVAKSGHLPK